MMIRICMAVLISSSSLATRFDNVASFHTIFCASIFFARVSLRWIAFCLTSNDYDERRAQGQGQVRDDLSFLKNHSGAKYGKFCKSLESDTLARMRAHLFSS